MNDASDISAQIMGGKLTLNQRKQIRIKDNISSDNYYDKMINECIIDTVIELINKERIHFKKGEPLLWDNQEK